MKSSKRCEPDSSGLDADFDLARDLPTTAEDIAALRRLREQSRSIKDLGPDWLDALEPPGLFGPIPQRQTTDEGREPFEL